MIDWKEHGFEDEKEVDEFLNELEINFKPNKETRTLGQIVEEIKRGLK